jgi:hypothetical protein
LLPVRLQIAILIGLLLTASVPGAGAQGDARTPLALHTDQALPLSADPYNGYMRESVTVHAVGYCTDEDLVVPAETTVNFRVLESPPQVLGEIPQSSITVELEPGDCPADVPAFDVAIELSIRSAPSAMLVAGETYVVQVEADMQKLSATGSAASYGPVQLNVTFEVGFMPGVLIRSPEGAPDRGLPGQTVAIPWRIQNLGNAEVRATVSMGGSVHEGPASSPLPVSDPEPVTLRPFEERTLNWTLSLPDEPGKSVFIQARAEVTPVDGRYGGSADHNASYAIHIEAGLGATPGIGFALTTIAVVAAALAAGRLRRAG